ncbi:hypothetical protein [Vibrio taketomensis]
MRPDVPVLDATNIVVGKGSFKISPIVGHDLQVRTDKFDMDAWIEMFTAPEQQTSSVLSELNTPKIPMPQRVDINSDELKLAGMEWNDVNFDAKRKFRLVYQPNQSAGAG